MELLTSTEWHNYKPEGGDKDGLWQGGRVGRSDATADTGGDTDISREGDGRAACRVSATGASTLNELRLLYRAGEISASNVQESLERPSDWSTEELDL
jgi:hypothetical protein